MCTEHIHKCRYCNKEYPCVISNDICPTMNFDDDRNLCRSCRDVLEDLLKNSLINLKNWKQLLGRYVK